MLFPTIDFAIFFGAVYLGHWLLTPFPKRWKLFMIGASYLFYGYWEWRFMALLAGATVLAQMGALAIAGSAGARSRKLALAVSVGGLLGLLGWFKYYGFFAVNVANALDGLGIASPLPLLQVTLPVGISFFTFMAVSYVIDVYRGDLEPSGWLDFFVYLSFFPHLVAGPIVRGGELLPQIRQRRDPRKVDLAGSAYRIFAGLFKKVVIASYLASAIVDPVFSDPGAHSSLEVLVAIYAFAVQIYADFSGYTDIAIGVARLMGFAFPENFNAPYAARSLQEFWRRWHMTLSRFLRDYVYIPLGGSRGSSGATYRNVVLTMVLAGLWHGAAWTFVVWGLIHGAGMAAGRWRQQRRIARGLDPMPDGPIDRVRQRVLTFHLVCLGWVFFRADSFGTAFRVLGRLVTGFGPSPAVTLAVVLAILVVIAAQYVPERLPRLTQDGFARLRPAFQGALLAGALFTITSLGPQGVAPFIYFQF
jgi:alginate O-acetyltransferase complex protein AlgI